MEVDRGLRRFQDRSLSLTIQHRGRFFWRQKQHQKQFIRKVKLDPSFREVNFNFLSVQSVPKNMCDFIF